MESHNWDEQKVNLELKNRKEILEYMVEKEMDEFDIVSLIQNYYVDALENYEIDQEDMNGSNKFAFAIFGDFVRKNKDELFFHKVVYQTGTYSHALGYLR